MPYSAGVIHGVQKDMIACTKELVLDGKNVKLDDLAIFSAWQTTTPAASAKDFSASANIKGFAYMRGLRVSSARRC